MKYPQLVEQGPGNWTRWVTPKTKYRLACCHCGLVHDMQFMVLLKGGKKLDRRKGQIKFRVRQNARATSAVRRSSVVAEKAH
jgi:hypothetical protein